jgi:lambda family phage tail tape measure protein
MASNNIARLGVVLGLDTAEFTAAIDKAILENKKLGQEIKRSSNAAADEIIKLKYATDDYGKSLTKVEEIQREIDAGKFAKAEEGLKAQLLAAAAAYDAKTASMKKFTGALTDQQKLQFTYQTTDLITQIASGQNAMIALLQQGGQLKDALGGIGNMFRAISDMITPFRVGMVGLAASIGSVAYAMFQGYKESRDYNNSLILTGRYAGLANAEMIDLAKSMSGQLNIAMGDARTIFKDLVESGKFSSTSITSVANAIANVARFSTDSASAVTQKLIPSFDGTSSSAKKLNEQYHFLTLEQYQYIQQLERQNRLQEAAAYTADALNRKLKDQQPELGYLETAWKGLRDMASSAWDAMMGWGRQKTTVDQIRSAAKEIERLTSEIGGSDTQSIADRAMNKQRLQQKIAEYQRLVEVLGKERADAITAQEETQKIADEQKYGATSRQNQRELLALQYKNEIDLAKVTANEEVRVRMDALQKFFTIQQEFEKKNFEEGGRLYIENLKIYQAKAIGIAQETEQSIREIRAKKAVELQEELLKMQEETFAEQARIDTLRANEFANQEKTLRLAQEQQKYDEMKAQAQLHMIGYTQTMIQLEMTRYDTAKKIADIDRQVAEGKMTEFQGDLLKKQTMQYAQAQENAINLGERLKLVQDINASVFNNMGNAIDNFVKTGKFAFKDFARSLIQDIIAIQMKAQAFKLLGMLTASFGGTSYSQLTTGSGVTNQFNPSIDYRADGGPVSANNPYVVGEAGPELFVPRSAGTIVPNTSLSAMGSAPTINYNGPFIQNMQAIDTQSAIQFLAKNKQAVFAANLSAQRSLPVNK